LKLFMNGSIRDWQSHYRHKFLAVEGTMRHIFTQGFAPGYFRGACFEIDAEVRPGMSGGPVFNEHGYVCGIISATASDLLARPSSLISLFYPALMTEVKFGAQMGQRLQSRNVGPVTRLSKGVSNVAGAKNHPAKAGAAATGARRLGAIDGRNKGSKP
jgi:S1-C subfamily serine protease